MNYRANPKNGDMLSILGFGCMRFPKDENETERLVLHAIENGVNYFDTAYMYWGSETTLGRILKRIQKRECVKIATKIPPAMIKKYSDLDKYLEQQLERLQTNYIDYYLMHLLTDVSIWERMEALGAKEWVDKKKAEGKIKNIGFSYHGGKDEFVKVCDAYGWDMCMIQYNYLDESKQAGKSGLRYAAGKGIPVMVMEPLRGGTLASRLPSGAAEAFSKAHVRRSPAEWSLKWIWDQPEATCVLSGMNSMDMLAENINVASASVSGEFSEADFEVVAKARKAIEEAAMVPCTGCGYCMPCPQGVDIPTCMSCYNNIVIEGKRQAQIRYMMQTSLKSVPQLASLCNKCGKCESRCPQQIAIRSELHNTAKRFEKFYFKLAVALGRRLMRLQ
jgi:predicted aldo/keto reductase-like oxidoreductase